LQLIQPGVSVRNFAQGVHSFYLRNNAANADDGQVYLLFSEEELPQQPDTVPFKNAILANNIRTLSITDIVLTAVIVPVAAGERFRILGYRVQLSWAIGAGAANGTSDLLARIESPASGVSDIGQIFAECRHTAAAVEQYWGQGDSGFVSLGEPGYTFGPGSDVEIAIGHNTAAGTAPAQIRATGIGEVWGVLEPVSIG
jgi:hypothetical protein